MQFIINSFVVMIEIYNYFQDLINTKIKQAKRKYFENISHIPQPEKVLVTPKNNFEW